MAFFQRSESCVKRMTEATPPTPHVRGGSVSRRGLNQAAGIRVQLTGGTKPEEKSQPKRQPLFGREREGGASLREAASLAYPCLSPQNAGITPPAYFSLFSM